MVNQRMKDYLPSLEGTFGVGETAQSLKRLPHVRAPVKSDSVTRVFNPSVSTAGWEGKAGGVLKVHQLASLGYTAANDRRLSKTWWVEGKNKHPGLSPDLYAYTVPACSHTYVLKHVHTYILTHIHKHTNTF